MKVLITGVAGFIGARLATLLPETHDIVGIDNLNDYYDVTLKQERLRLLGKKIKFVQMDLCEKQTLEELFKQESFDIVINLAAQAGVRYSIENPDDYIQSNVVGFLNILEACRKYPVKHLLFASSSSVYGGNKKIPFSTEDNVDHPVSLYAATKKSNELMAHAYANLYQIPVTGLRFFTVYGPMGRPDMAYYGFTDKIVRGEAIQVFNHGKMMRDFTYIDDICDGIIRLLNHIPKGQVDYKVSDSWAPYKIYNIGNNNPVQLGKFIEIIEKHLGIEAKKEYLPMQDGDVVQTFADISDLSKETGYQPTTDLDEGIKKFVEWYKAYYAIGENIGKK